MGTKELLTLTEYAERKGTSYSAVVKKIRNGTISRKALVKIDGKKRPRIDPVQADADIEANADPDRISVAATPATETFRAAKTSTETMRARKLELEVQELEGKLLHADEVRKKIAKLVGETKDAFLNLPAKITPVLISISDPVEFETRLMKEINSALGTLSRVENGL